jgi:plasmid maintenance system killer protein
MTIRSFCCADTEALHEGRSPRRFRNIENEAHRKLQMLDAAVELRDMLARYFNTTAQFWLNLQSSFDLKRADMEEWQRIAVEVHPLARAI